MAQTCGTPVASTMASRVPSGETRGGMLIGPGEGRGVASKGGPAPPTPIKTTCSFSLSIPTNLPSGNESTIVVEGEMLSNPAGLDRPHKKPGPLGGKPKPPPP